MYTYSRFNFQGFSTLILLLALALVSAATIAGFEVYQQQDDSKVLEAEGTMTADTGTSFAVSDVAGEQDPIAPTEDLVEVEPVQEARGAEGEMVPALVEPSGIQTIVLAGGCFWCTEAYLQEAPGVLDAVSGYAGGTALDANYKAVSSGKTLHREAVQVTYDPKVITTAEVLDVYWAHIDPTDAGGQFADRGTQYTTAIYFQSEFQKEVAIRSKARLESSGLFEKPVVTLILPYTTFFPAEDYHQDYYKKASEYYERYKKGSGRADFIDDNWAKEAALEFLAE